MQMCCNLTDLDAGGAQGRRAAVDASKCVMSHMRCCWSHYDVQLCDRLGAPGCQRRRGAVHASLEF